MNLIHESLPPERLSSLLSLLVALITNNNDARLKPALIDKLRELLTDMTRSACDSSATMTQQINKQAVPLALKLLDDNKSKVRTRTEKLLRKLFAIIGQQ